MRRSRTPTTAWPAVADLMTILAVVGLTAAAAAAATLARRGDEAEAQMSVLRDSIGKLNAMVQRLDETSAARRDSIAGLLGPRQQGGSSNEVGFVPCWRVAPGARRSFRAYDVVKRQDDRYSVSLHEEFEAGIRGAPPLPSPAQLVLRDVDGDLMSKSELADFARRVSSAVEGVYGSRCKLTVKVSQDMTVRESNDIAEAGLYPTSW